MFSFTRLYNKYFSGHRSIKMYLSTIPFVLSMLIGAIYLYFYGKPFSGQIWEFWILCSTFFLWGLSGLLMAIVKETPTSMSRLSTIIMGVFTMIFSWGMVILILVYIIENW